MANSLVPYPTDLSTPCQILLSRFTANPATAKEMAHAAYQIEGVGLGSAFSDAPTLKRGCPPPSDEECQKALRDCCCQHGAFGDWLKANPQVFQAVLSLALSILGTL